MQANARRAEAAADLATGRALRPAHRTAVARAALRAILVVHAQALVRHGMVLTLASQHPGVRIHQAASAEEATELLGRPGDLDLMVVDLDLIEAAGLEAIRRASARGVSVIVLASSGRPEDVVACIRAGARGYVAKSGSSMVLEQSIALALSDDCYIPVPRSALERRAATRMPEGAAAGVVERLTGRQQDIFRLLLAGHSNKEIARTLGVLEGTVKVHVRAVMQKLRVRNRTQVAVAAARLGLPAGLP